MSKLTEPRYTGHSGTGVDLDVELEDGQTVPYHVDHGDYLPLELRGVKVKPEFVRSLLKQEDAWKAKQPRSETSSGPDNPAAAEKE